MKKNQDQPAEVEARLALDADLYDSASVGHLTLDREGAIRQVNVTGARLLGVERSRLVNRCFGLFVAEDDRRTFSDFLEKVFASQAEKSCEVTLPRNGSQPLVVRIESTRSEDGQECRAVVMDITERKRAEMALRKSEARFRNLYENTPIGLYRTTPDGRLLLANPTLVRTLGYASFDELAQVNLKEDNFHPAYPRRKFSEQIERDGEVRGLESAWLRRDGSVVAIRENARAVRDAAGKDLYYEGTIEDITERKRAEEALHESEARLKDITFSMADWVWEMDENGVYTYYSSKGLELFGDVIGKTPFDFMPPEEAKRVAAIFSEIVRNKAPIRDLENWSIRKNGERICLLTNGVPILDKAGNLKGYRGVDKDVTERRRTKEALKLFRSLVDQSHDGIETLDPETGRFLDVNERSCQNLGYSREEYLALRVFEVDPMCDQSAFTKVVGELRKAGVLMWEGCHRRKDGSTFPVESSLKYVRLDRDYIVAVVRDITERKRAEEALRQHTEEMCALNQKLTRFDRAGTGRELRMIELKQEVNELCRRLGEPPRHAVNLPPGGGVPSAAPDPAPPGGGGS